MRLAENKYASSVERGLWGGQSDEQKQIIALTTTVSKLQNSLKLKRGKGQNPQDQKQDKGKGNGKKKGKGNGKNDDKKWAWKTVSPKRGETTKKFGGKQYHWCPNHAAWCLHTAEECNKGVQDSSEPAQTSDTSQGNGNNVSFAASVSSIMNELEDDE